jgi:hypothetical protein
VTSRLSSARPDRRRAVLAAALLLAASAAALQAEAKGTATYKGKRAATVTFTHAYLVRQPELGGDQTIRRLVLSSEDVGAALKACKTRICTDGGIGDGMTVDLGSGPRLDYWFVANDQRIQYSGTASAASATLTTDSPARLAGTLKFDASAAGGPVVDVTFDASLVLELSK